MTLVGIDTGGTFTDFVFQEGGGWRVRKCLSTPSNPALAVLEGLHRIGGAGGLHVVHGSTVATNALLEHKGARTALIANQGFEDVIEIGRQDRHALYDLRYHRPPALIPARRRFGLRCRMDCAGRILEDLDLNAAEKLVQEIEQAGIESVAVSFLFSFKNPVHERMLGRMLCRLGIPVSLSHEILSEFREYERTSTTVINAYVAPKIQGYLKSVLDFMEGAPLRIMQSNGGSISARTAMREPVRTIFSGPAGGVVGAFEIGRAAGFKRLITFDMGGTSTDVALIDDRLPLTLESSIAKHPVRVPMIDIHTVGAGGGSIARMDSGGALQVGPQSAGSDPGPVCYGKGSHLTVTDANLFLGRLIPDHFLGGSMRLHPDRISAPFRQMAEQARLSEIQVAEGIVQVVNAAMERAIRVVSVERGFDPAEFTLFAFGGAGGLHAVSLARLLHIPRVLAPVNPGILSAIGMLLADVVKDYSLTVMISGGCDPHCLEEMFAPLETEAVRDLKAEGIPLNRISLKRYLDMRYEGQSHEILVPAQGGNPVAGFHELHRCAYGYCSLQKNTEIVNIRLRAVGASEKPVLEKGELSREPLREACFLGNRPVVFDGRFISTPVLSRQELCPGNRIQGPAVLVEYSSTIILPPDSAAWVDDFGNLLIETWSD